MDKDLINMFSKLGLNEKKEFEEPPIAPFEGLSGRWVRSL
jgi:hypothetical protein